MVESTFSAGPKLMSERVGAEHWNLSGKHQIALGLLISERLRPIVYARAALVCGIAGRHMEFTRAVASFFHLPLHLIFVGPVTENNQGGAVIGAVSGTDDTVALDEDLIATQGISAEQVFHRVQGAKYNLLKEVAKESVVPVLTSRSALDKIIILADALMDDMLTVQVGLVSLKAARPAAIIPAAGLLYRKAMLNVSGCVEPAVSLREFNALPDLYEELNIIAKGAPGELRRLFNHGS